MTRNDLPMRPRQAEWVGTLDPAGTGCHYQTLLIFHCVDLLLEVMPHA